MSAGAHLQGPAAPPPRLRRVAAGARQGAVPLRLRTRANPRQLLSEVRPSRLGYEQGCVVNVNDNDDVFSDIGKSKKF